MKGLPLYIGNRYSDLRRIIYRVFSSAFFAVKHRYDPGSMADHPFISYLKARTAVPITDILHEIRCRQYGFILFLPLPFPTFFKAIIRAGAHQLYRVTLVTKAQYDLCSPNVHAPCHACNKDIQSVSKRLTDFSFQVLFDGFLTSSQFLRAMSRKA